MGPPDAKRRPGGGGAAVITGNEIAAQNSSSSRKIKPPLRLITSPFLELEAARRDYEGALLGYYYDRDPARVRQRINGALCRIANARAALASARR